MDVFKVRKRTFFLLPIAPDACESLLVGSRIPVYSPVSISTAPPKQVIPTWIEEDESIGSYEVYSTSTGLTAEKKNKFLPLRIIELIYELLSLRDSHSTIKTEASVPINLVSN
jgi:hypothetical protein